MNIKSQLTKLHLYNAFFSFRITDAVWVVFLLSQGYSLAQVGLAEGIFHIVSFICEIPTGMAADLLGRKRTLAVSGVCGVLSALFMACSSSFWGVCLSMAFNALMYNFNSGTLSAIVYDSLVMAGREEDYLKVNAWLDGSWRTLSAIACLLGGFALWLGIFRAYLVTALLASTLILLAITLVEPAVTAAQQARTQNPFHNLGPRLLEHIHTSVAFLRRNPRIACKILADAGIAVPNYLLFMYLQQHLVDSGLAILWLGVALLAVRLSGSLGVLAGARWKQPLFSLTLLCAAGVGLGTLLAGATGQWAFALAGAMAAYFFDAIAQLRLEAAMNHDFPSDQRATLLSVDSMAYSLLMMVASPLSGVVGDLWGLPWAFGLMGSGLILAALCCSWVYRRKAA